MRANEAHFAASAMAGDAGEAGGDQIAATGVVEQSFFVNDGCSSAGICTSAACGRRRAVGQSSRPLLPPSRSCY